MTIFSSFSANFPPHYHTILAINCVHASNRFTHLQQTQQTDGQSDNSVLTVRRDCHVGAARTFLELLLTWTQQSALSAIRCTASTPFYQLGNSPVSQARPTSAREGRAW